MASSLDARIYNTCIAYTIVFMLLERIRPMASNSTFI